MPCGCRSASNQGEARNTASSTSKARARNAERHRSGVILAPAAVAAAPPPPAATRLARGARLGEAAEASSGEAAAPLGLRAARGALGVCTCHWSHTWTPHRHHHTRQASKHTASARRPESANGRRSKGKARVAHPDAAVGVPLGGNGLHLLRRGQLRQLVQRLHALRASSGNIVRTQGGRWCRSAGHGEVSSRGG